MPSNFRQRLKDCPKLPHIHFELYYDTTGKKKKTVQRAIIKGNRMNASAIKATMNFQSEQFLIFVFSPKNQL